MSKDVPDELSKHRLQKSSNTEGAEPPLCSFCGKGKNQVELMIEGPRAHICNECVKLCKDIIT